MRLFTFLVTLLSSILIMISFIFSVLALKSHTWATSSIYTSPDGTNSKDTRRFYGKNSRGPFNSAYNQQNLTTGNFTLLTTSNSICLDLDEQFLCQQLRIGAKTLVAGTAFTGLAFIGGYILAFFTFLIGRKRNTMRSVGMVLKTFVMLMTVLGILGIAIGGTITTNVLVNQQRPDGDSISDLSDNPLQDHWLIGKGVEYAFLGWILSVIGLVLFPPIASAKLEDGHGHRHQYRRSQEREHGSYREREQGKNDEHHKGGLTGEQNL